MNLIKEKQLLCERTLLFESIITRTAVHSHFRGILNALVRTRAFVRYVTQCCIYTVVIS